MSKKPKKKPRPIAIREAALVRLRTARDLAKRGWIKKGRESVRHMMLDCIEEAHVEHGGHLSGWSRSVEPELGMMLAYTCRCFYKGNDPGTNPKRYKQFVKYGGGHSLYQYNVLADACRLLTKELQELRAKERAK